MRKLTGVLLAIIFLLFGIILGFLFAPIKKGICIKDVGNNNGSNNKENSNCGTASTDKEKKLSDSYTFEPKKRK